MLASYLVDLMLLYPLLEKDSSTELSVCMAMTADNREPVQKLSNVKMISI